MGLDRRTRPTITKPQGESIFQTGFHDRVLPLAPMARRLPSLDPPCTCNDRAGSVFAGSCIWRSKHARIEHFHTSPGKHCPGHLLPNSKTCFGAGAKGTLSKWIKVAHSGNGQRWMVLFERTRFLPKWHFIPKFPFVRRDWKSQRLGMGDRQDPATIREIEVSSSMYPAQWHLNTTGKWMSFVHQGHLWVAPWEQPWNGSL